jgi:sarcosine oxidase subunit alpha
MWGLRISLVNLTGQLTAFNLAGPHARKVLARITAVAIDSASFPFMAAREGHVAGAPGRLLRIGFVGELGYEIHVPADHGAAVWDAMFKAGGDFDIRPFGVEAQRVLRLEKGHPIVGQDTDGVTNPLEAGLAWALKDEKPFYIGQRSLAVLRKSALKQTLVGFTLQGSASQRPKECHLAIHAGDIAGRITSITWSPTLGCIIGLALVAPELKSQGWFEVRVDDGSMVRADIVALPFHDAEHARQHVGDADVIDHAAPTIASASHATESHSTTVAQAWPDASGVELVDVAAVHGGATPARFGCKGQGAAAWLMGHGIEVPQLPNTWTFIGDVLCARLGMGEYLVEATPVEAVAEQAVRGFAANLHGAIAQGVAPVVRVDSEWILRGPRVHELLLQVCSFNFRSLDLHAAPVVLTLLLGVAVTVIARETGHGIEYRIWFDNSYATTLREALMEIATEMAIEHA